MSHPSLINPLLADGLPDLDKVIPFLRQLFELAFGNQNATEALRITTWILLVIVALALLWVMTWLIARIKRFASRNIVPLVYNAEQRRRAHKRRYFAEHVEQEIRLLNSREDWKDNRFAELEAEVEATGRFSSFFGIPVPLLGQTDGLRRERSLSEALLKSAERLILLEGDPGSGKSTALRHLAYRKARAATQSRSARSISLFI